MSVWIRVELAAVALAVYAVLLLWKALDIRKLRPRSPEIKILRFDFIRLGADMMILLSFLLVGDICPAWFNLFQDTPLGYCTACSILISFTLLVSVFVDWFPFREGCRIAGRQIPSFAKFALKQFISVFRIELALILVWCVFLILEPTKTSLIIRIILSALILLFMRLLLRFTGCHSKQTKEEEKPDGTEA